MRLIVKTFPKEWDNEQRMNNLYAPFRKKELNPVDYDSKMRFWRTFINSTLADSSCCSFTLDELEKAFIHNGRKPMCLKEVIDNILSDGEINYQTSFEALLPSEDTWTSWAVKSLVSTPIKWSFGKLKESLLAPTPTCYDNRFVHLPVTKNIANELLSRIDNDLKGIILTMEKVTSLCKGCVVNEHDLDVALHWLVLQGQAIVTLLGDKKLVKFPENGQKIEQISEADKAVFSLKQNEQQLMASVENLEVQKQEMVQEAKNYLKKGMRPMAKSCLRKKKELEKQIDKNISALDNIHMLLTRIEDTESNTKVLESYKVSISTLKNQFKEAGLSEENVGNIMEQVQEVLDIHDDIQSMLGDPASSCVTSDEDCETELEELLKNKETDKQTDKEFSLGELDFPEPPSSSPSSVKVPKKEIRNLQQALA